MHFEFYLTSFSTCSLLVAVAWSNDIISFDNRVYVEPRAAPLEPKSSYETKEKKIDSDKCFFFVMPYALFVRAE